MEKKTGGGRNRGDFIKKTIFGKYKVCCKKKKMF